MSNQCIYEDKIMADKLHEAILSSARTDEKLTVLLEQSLKIAEKNNDTLVLHNEEMDKSMTEAWNYLKDMNKNVTLFVEYVPKFIKWVSITFGILIAIIILLLGGETVLNKAINIFT